MALLSCSLTPIKTSFSSHLPSGRRLLDAGDRNFGLGRSGSSSAYSQCRRSELELGDAQAHVGESWRRRRRVAPGAYEGEPGDGDSGELDLVHSCAMITPGVALSLPVSPIAMEDLIACVLTSASALALLKVFDELAKRDVLDKKLSRKLVHISVGLVYMLFWPLFTLAPQAKYLCALAPAMNGVRMLGLGFGILKNEAMVKSMTRGGDRRELLKGPFYYALAITLTTIFFWRNSAVGIVSLVNLCAGDGFADIIGRNFGGSKLPYNNDKSYAGSVAMFVASTLTSMLYLQYYAHFGLLQILPGMFAGVMIVSFLTALVESLPISTRLDDNLTVPFTAVALGMLILPR